VDPAPFLLDKAQELAADLPNVAFQVHDRWLVRRLPALVRGCGFEVVVAQPREQMNFYSAA
jgi:hypothetical protein